MNKHKIMVIQYNRMIECDLLRIFCTVLLLVDHSFAIFAGFWSMPSDCHSITSYYWLGRFSYSFMLPLWTFISGYIWGYQIIQQHKTFDLSTIICKKAYRLLLPCYLFGFLYLLFTGNLTSLGNIKGFVVFFSGVQHLWFLPMLFWCFVFSYFLMKIKIKEIWLMILLVVCNIISWNICSFGILSAIHYLLWFQLGFFIFKYKDKIPANLLSSTFIIFGIICFFICFIPLTDILDSIENKWSNISLDVYGRSISQIQMHLTSFPYEFIGVMLSYLLCIKSAKYIIHDKFQISKLASYCFGIYVIHHFILEYLYFHTGFPSYINSYALPWICLFITAISSFILTKYLTKFQIGKALLS